MNIELQETAEKSIWMPYDWSTGEAIGTLLTGLREGEIVAAICDECDKQMVPARSFCRDCQAVVTTYETVPETGTINLATVVRTGRPAAPFSPPYALALIQIDGANTELLHVVQAEFDTLDELGSGQSRPRGLEAS